MKKYLTRIIVVLMLATPIIGVSNVANALTVNKGQEGKF